MEIISTTFRKKLFDTISFSISVADHDLACDNVYPIATAQKKTLTTGGDFTRAGLHSTMYHKIKKDIQPSA
jgi:hypothetical protein